MKFFVVPHQHFDLVWRRETAWYEERRRTLYRQALELLTRQPELTFSFSQIASFRHFVERHPEHRAVLQELLDSGRLEFIGAPLSIPDLNMTSAAAQLMNCSAGRQWLHETFGVDTIIGAFEDAFGVPAQLPQLLRLAGYRVYKAGRMPRTGRDDVGGNFLLEAQDGSTIRCIGNGPAGMSWGWGFSQNPDEVFPDIVAERYDRIRADFVASLEASLAAGLKYTLFTVMGEEQPIFPELPRLIADLQKEYAPRGVEIAFSTFRKYYEALPDDYWKRVPVVPSTEDLSRLFTGCYTSRMASKMAPRRLEYRIQSAQAAGVAVAPRDIENLALLQFHDAICGCHIDENARYLARLAAESNERLAEAPGVIPVAPQLPDWKLAAEAVESTPGAPVRFGDWELNFDADGHLGDCRFRGVSHGPIAQVMFREEHGTMWTEEYGPGRHFVAPKAESVDAVKRDGKALTVITSYYEDRFRKFWPGLARVRYRKELTFVAASPWVRVAIVLDILGNSTEVALRWGGDAMPQHECRAEIPLGSVVRHACIPHAVQGDVFPALNFVAGDGFGVLNSGTPGHALRDGRLETLLLRSPVKRWSPWFPVTPTETMWDNGPRCYELVYGAESAGGMGAWHRAGMEFNGRLASPHAVAQVPAELAGLPDNLVPMEFVRDPANGRVEAVIVEVEGNKANWRGTEFRPREAKRMVLHD